MANPSFIRTNKAVFICRSTKYDSLILLPKECVLKSLALCQTLTAYSSNRSACCLVKHQVAKQGHGRHDSLRNSELGTVLIALMQGNFERIYIYIYACIIVTVYVQQSFLDQRFIMLFTRTHQRCITWARLIQSTSSTSVSLRSILILFRHVLLALLSRHSGFQTKILYVFIIFRCVLHGPPLPYALNMLWIYWSENKKIWRKQHFLR